MSSSYIHSLLTIGAYFSIQISLLSHYLKQTNKLIINHHTGSNYQGTQPAYTELQLYLVITNCLTKFNAWFKELIFKKMYWAGTTEYEENKCFVTIKTNRAIALLQTTGKINYSKFNQHKMMLLRINHIVKYSFLLNCSFLCLNK